MVYLMTGKRIGLDSNTDLIFVEDWWYFECSDLHQELISINQKPAATAIGKIWYCDEITLHTRWRSGRI